MHDRRHHNSHERLLDMLARVREVLPGLPGFRSLSLFGSLAEGRADGYSDIDVIVTVDHLSAAKERVLGLLERVGAVEFCWAISLRSDEWNPTIAFRDEGYYHKLDLGLAHSSATDRTIRAEQTTLLVDRPAVLGSPDPQCAAYVPEPGSTGHFLLGQFIGCTRYLKARRRGQAMTCYRFAAAAVDWRLALLYARLTGNAAPGPKLSTNQYRGLDALMSPGERAGLSASMDFTSPEAMDNTVRCAVEGMLEDGLAVASGSGEEVRVAVLERMSAFLRGELSAADSPG